MNPKDPLLYTFVRLANNDELEMEIGITLNVKGLIVSGLLVSYRKYLQGIADGFKEATNPVMGEALSSAIEDIKTKLPTEDIEYSFIHLKNARFYGLGDPIPTNQGIWWRGDLSEIDAFTIGNFS